MSKFTIITNTIRRPLDLVVRSVRASLAQDPLADVILVDQNPQKINFPSDVVSHAHFRHLHFRVPAVSMARNSADYSHDCEWLIFCDDDGYLEEGYLHQLQSLIARNPDVEIFAGAIKRTDNGEYYSKRHAMGGNMEWFVNAKLLMGSNFVIQRAMFEQLGKFDEKFGAGAVYGSSEETDLAWNAFFHRAKMRYSPELVVFHVPPMVGDTLAEALKAFRYGVGKSALVRKWFFHGHPVVVLEFVEMILMPIFRAPLALLRLRLREALIQAATLLGRLSGLVIVRKIQQ